MLMFLVICIKPDALLSEPNQHIFTRCLNKKFYLFETAQLAEHYVRKQQILSKKHFLIMPFNSDLQDSLTSCDSQQFYKNMQEPTYFLPHSTHRGTKIRFANEHKLMNEDERFICDQGQPAQEVAPRPDPNPVHVPARVAPMQIPVIPPAQVLPVPVPIPAPQQIVKIKNPVPKVNLKRFEKLPDDFLLGSSLIEDIKQNSFNDPVQYDEYALSQLDQLACYRTANGYYQLYTMRTIEDLPKNISAWDTTFKDPLSGEMIDMKNVRAVTPELLKAFLKQSPANIDEIQEKTSLSFSRC